MSVKKKLRILLGIWLGFCAYGESWGHENDLSPFHSVSLRAEVKTVRQVATGKMALHLRVPHTYTNSLACSGHLSFGVEGEAVERGLQISDMLVIPDGAFGRPLSFSLPISLQAGETLAPSFFQEREILCRGWDARIPLPEGLCKNSVLVPGFLEACRMVAPGADVPWIRNGIYIGACRCYKAV